MIKNKFWSKNGLTFIIAAIIVFIVSIIAIVSPNEFGNVITKSKSWVSKNFSTFFLIIPLIFLIVLGFFVFTKWGKKKIGTGRPQYKTFTWLAMLFTAGVGVGTLTFGVAEPIYHAADPHLADGVLIIGNKTTPTTIHNASKAAKVFRDAIAFSVWDWGLPAMSIYTISGLVVAWFAFNKRYKASFQPGSVIEQGFGGKTWAKWVGSAANILAAITAIFTVAASLAIAGGNMTDSLSIAFFSGNTHNDFSKTMAKALPIIFIGIIASVYIIGSITPLKKGMAVLGNYTMYIGLALLAFVFLVGPSQFFMKQIINGLGSMPGSVMNHFGSFPYDEMGAKWLESWPIAYILWWISWTPFMGVFLARISQGRTFRQYAFASVVVPAIFMAIWFSVFGGFAFKSLQLGQASIFDKVATTGSVNGAFFELMHQFPLFKIVGVVTLGIFITFVATTGISASTSIASIVSKEGDEKPNKSSILVWAIGMTAIAIGLKLASGDSSKVMNTIRDTAVLLGAPYLIVLILQIIVMFKSIYEENQLIKSGKITLNNDDKELPKFKMSKTTYLQNRRYAIIINAFIGLVWIIMATLTLRGVFTNQPSFGVGHTSLQHINATEYAFSIIFLIYIILTFIINTQLLKLHSYTSLKITFAISIITLNIGTAILIFKMLRNMSGMKLFNREIEIKKMAPIEYEKWLIDNKKNK